MARPAKAPAPEEQSDLELPEDPSSTSKSTKAEQSALKAKVFQITDEVEDLKRQLDLKKELLSDAVFELKQSRGGKSFKDPSGMIWRFASRGKGKEVPAHFLQRVGAQDVEEL